MFSFHKPKIYRSISGCCICKAKSSSSRFTDSKKYEAEFERCFRIQEKRTGEICNACVLLVKRWKKLSPENRCIKNWHHVVDARAGPGTKSYLSKQQQQQNHQQSGQSTSGSSVNRENHRGRPMKPGNTKAHSGYLPTPKFQVGNVHEDADDDDDDDDIDDDDDDDNYLKQMNIGKGLGRRGTKSSTTTTSNLNNKQLLTANNSNTTSKYNDICLTTRHKTANNLGVYPALVMASTNSQLDNLEDDDDDLDNISRGKRHKRKPLFSCRFRSGGGDPSVDNMEAMEHHKTAQQQQRQQLRFSSRMAKKASTSPHSSSCPATISTSQSGKSDPASHQFRPHELSSCSAGVNTSNKRRRKCCDSSKITSLLDMTLWKKEKICCGIIFRGLHDEVAIFPKLLRPCSCRLKEMMSSSPRTHSITKGAPSSNSAGESSMSSSSLSDSISITSSNDETASNISIQMTTSNANHSASSGLKDTTMQQQPQQQSSSANNNSSDAISTTSSSNSMMLVEDSDSSNSDSISSQSVGSTSNSIGSNSSVTNANSSGVNNQPSSSNNVNVAAH